MELVRGELGSSHIKFNRMIQFKVLHCLGTGLQLETHVVPNYTINELLQLKLAQQLEIPEHTHTQTHTIMMMVQRQMRCVFLP